MIEAVAATPRIAASSFSSPAICSFKARACFNWSRDGEFVMSARVKETRRKGQCEDGRMEPRYYSGWRFLSFPRRGKHIRFKLYGRGTSSQWDLLADFRAPNPAPGPYPVWKPMTLPATVTRGGLKFTLVKLVSGTKIGRFIPREKPPHTRATCRIEQNGGQAPALFPWRMSAIDATGNKVTYRDIEMGTTNGFVFYDARGLGLSPSEVWRLTIELTDEKVLPEGYPKVGSHIYPIEFLARPTRE